MADASRTLSNSAASAISFHIPSPQADTNYYIDVASASYSIDDALVITESGSCVVGFYIRPLGDGGHGVSIGGLDPMNATTAENSADANGFNNDAEADDQIILSVTSISSPVDLRGRINLSRT